MFSQTGASESVGDATPLTVAAGGTKQRGVSWGGAQGRKVWAALCTLYLQQEIDADKHGVTRVTRREEA